MHAVTTNGTVAVPVGEQAASKYSERSTRRGNSTGIFPAREGHFSPPFRGYFELIAGPVLHRELISAPRRPRTYVVRVAYVAALFLLLSTAWQVLAGTQVVRNIGDLARFASTVFQILAPLQLAVVVFFAATSAASAVALEKDRRTLELLLLTRLSNVELVVGKLLASLAGVAALVVASIPVFAAWVMLGGVSFAQVGRVMSVTMVATVVAGSLGSTLALWRDKTFQTLAMTALAIVTWTAFWEVVAWGALGETWLGVRTQAFAIAFSPWQALQEAAREVETGPTSLGMSGRLAAFFAVSSLIMLGLNGLAIWKVRTWNPTQELRPKTAEDQDATSSVAQEVKATQPAKALVSRPVWDNPVLWREVRTRAYGRKMLLVHVAYWLVFGLLAVWMHGMLRELSGSSLWQLAGAVGPFVVLSLVLVNAQAVTSLTSERDSKALELLLVTDLTPVEFIAGKLAGTLYNSRFMIALPMALAGYLWWREQLSAENLAYVWAGWLVMVFFVATLGVHVGMNYVSSRTAIAISLGTVFFLFVGIAVCMRIMVAFSNSFQVQLQPFFAFMVGGGVGLHFALNSRNRSAAIGLASFLCPVLTFYVLTSLLLEMTTAPFLVVVATYGFTTAAMLVPAIFEFDVATGRTVGADEG